MSFLTQSIPWLVILALFVWQIALYRRCREKWIRLQAVANSLASGGFAVLNHPSATPIPWLSPIRRGLKAAQRVGREPPDTDEAIQDLVRQVSTDNDLITLERLGHVAPFLGMVLTAFSFKFFNPATSTAEGALELGRIVGVVAPLMLGVAAAAVLAIFNQLLLHLAHCNFNQVIQAVRNWHESALDTWFATDQRSVDPLASPIEKLLLSAKALETSSEAHSKAALSAIDSANAVGRLGVAIEVALGQYALRSEAIQETLNSLDKRIDSANAAIGGLGDAAREAIAAFARSLLATGGQFALAVNQVESGASKLTNAITDHLVPAMDSLDEIRPLPGDLGHVVQQTKDSSGTLEAMTRGHYQVATQLEMTTSTLQNAMTGSASAIDQMNKTIENMGTIATRIVNLIPNFEAAGLDLSRLTKEGTRGPADRLAELEAAILKIQAVAESLRPLENTATAATNMEQSAAQMAATARALKKIVDQMATAKVVRGTNGDLNGKEMSDRQPWEFWKWFSN